MRYAGGVSAPESRPPRLTDAERRQLAELERNLLTQFPDLQGGLGQRPTVELKRARLVLFAIALLLVAAGAVLGGLGGAATVLLSVGGTAGILLFVNRNLAHARAAVEHNVARRAGSGAS